MRTVLMQILPEEYSECSLCSWDNPQGLFFLSEEVGGEGYILCTSHAIGILIGAAVYVSAAVTTCLSPIPDEGFILLRRDGLGMCEILRHGDESAPAEWERVRAGIDPAYWNLCVVHAAQKVVEYLDNASWGGPPPPDPGYIAQVCPVCDVVMVSQGLPTDKYRHEH